MGQSLRGWNTRLVIATLALVCTSGWVAAAPPANLPPSEQPRQEEESPAAPVEAKPDAADKGKAVPRVSVHVWMIEFETTSNEAVADFGSRFQSALAKSRATGNSAEFLTSNELASLVREFRRKGEVVIREEKPLVVMSGQTAKWGDTPSMSIKVTPTVLPEGLGLSTFFEFRRVENLLAPGTILQRGEGTTIVDPKQTLFIGGSERHETRTEILQVPWLCEDPTVGRWFRIPVTRTVRNCGYILASMAIVPEDDAQEGSE